MSKTYTLYATTSTSKGGIHSGWNTAVWNDYYLVNQGNTRRAGQLNSNYYATYFMFNQSTLASLQSKTIQSITLTVNITGGTGIPGGSSDLYPIRAKVDTATGGDSGSTAWKGGDSILTYVRRASGSSTTFSITMPTTVPSYGYVIGAVGAGYGQFIEFGEVSSGNIAKLDIVTNETDYSYTLAYNANGGSGAPSSQTGSNTRTSPSYTFTISSTKPTRSGYTFGGWALSSSATSAAYSAGGTITVSSSGTTTLYAYWIKVHTLTLSYNANNGSGAPSSQSATVATNGTPSYSFTISSTKPTRTGHSFQGWATSSSATSASYASGGSITISANTTLYAVWKADTYPVSYNANGGTGAPSSQTKTYGVTLTLSSTVPTRTGYIFQGWATSSTGSVAYQPGGSYTANAGATLYAIWKAANSTLSSVSNTAIGSSGTASWNIIDSTYTYKLVLTYSNAPSVTVNVAANHSSTSFTIPTTWYAYLPNSTSATASATLTTYSGSNALGSSTKNFTVSVGSSIKPSISAFTHTPSSTNSTVNGWGVYVQGYTRVNLSVTATAGTGASIISYAFSGPGLSQTGTGTTAQSSVIDSSGSKTYTVTVTDSRGRTASSSVSPSFNAYSTPTVSSLSSFRCLSDGTRSDTTGTYAKSTPVFSYSTVGGKNSLSTKKLEYKLHSGSSWTTAVSSVTSGTAYTFGGSLEIANSYDIRCTVTDAVGNSGVLTALLPPVVGIAFGLKNDRARFGGPVEKAGLQVDWDAEFNGVVDITPRRCYATLSSAGWYRVCAISCNSYAEAIGAAGGILRFAITDSYASYPNDAHTIDLLLAHNKVTFVNEASAANGYLEIDKIRYTFTGTSPYNGYVDIHFLGRGGATYVGISFDYTGIALIRQARVVAQNLQSVGPSPSGETVLTEYTFAADTEAVGTVVGASGFTPAEIDVKRSGRVVYVHFFVRNVSIAANTNTLIGTISGVPLPEKHIRWLAGGGAQAYDAVTPVYAILGTDGSIKVKSPSAISAVNITISYIV